MTAESYLGQPVGEFLDALSAGGPTPGGGAAAAVTVALGAGLAAMAARLSTRHLSGAEELAAAADAPRRRAASTHRGRTGRRPRSRLPAAPPATPPASRPGHDEKEDDGPVRLQPRVGVGTRPAPAGGGALRPRDDPPPRGHRCRTGMALPRGRRRRWFDRRVAGGAGRADRPRRGDRRPDGLPREA